MDLYEELMAVVEALAERGADYALCGGLAVGLHGYLRFTRDIDLLIRKEDLDTAVEAAKTLGFEFEAGIIPFEVGTPERREVFRISKIQDNLILTLDLMIVNASLESVWEERGVIEWQGRQVQVVSLEGLKEMKLMAGRDQDILDLKKLGLIEDDSNEKKTT